MNLIFDADAPCLTVIMLQCNTTKFCNSVLALLCLAGFKKCSVLIERDFLSEASPFGVLKIAQVLEIDGEY